MRRAHAPPAQVGEQTRGWANGKMLVFDTSFIHETFNEGNQVRRRSAAHDVAPRRSLQRALSGGLLILIR